MIKKIRNRLRYYGDIIALVLIGFILFQNANYLKASFKKYAPQTTASIEKRAQTLTSLQKKPSEK